MISTSSSQVAIPSASGPATSVRTRFAPSPTGFIHLGNIRSALYPWAFARKENGVFILRIEDTDTQRSTTAAVQVILEAMEWLGLQPDEGPFYQSARTPRYRQVIDDMLERGLAYLCYMSEEELDTLREAQRARGEKPRYDGRWRPEPGKVLPIPPAGVQPVVRFKNPQEGSVSWQDAVKGAITISNSELDDVVIARPDGSPTYNFCVVVDDLDMQITHVIRGDDHVNNTPRQINILRALGAQPPVYAHLPTVLDPSGEKMSKRNGALSVLQYREEGYLPEAVVNYLARLGWSHGNDEIFSKEQFIAWFDLDHLGASAAQFNAEKLQWLNLHYIKQMEPALLAEHTRPFLLKQLADAHMQAEQAVGEVVLEASSSENALVKAEAMLQAGPDLAKVLMLLKDRVHTLKELATQALNFYIPPQHSKNNTQESSASTLTESAHEALRALSILFKKLADSATWQREAIQAALKTTVQAHGLKFPQIAMPLRLAVMGTTHTPAIDAVLELFDPALVCARMDAMLAQAVFND